MRKTKGFLSLLMVAVLLMGLCSAVSAQTASASLYGVYGDGMLFAQNAEAVLSGTALSGTEISAELFDASGKKVTEGFCVTDKNGEFSVSFTSPEGSYEEYSIVLKADSKVFRTLNNVVFGELWLASGQSNMQYPLAQAESAAEDFLNGKKLSKWIRVLLVPAYPEYNGSDSLVPCEPQKDIKSAEWVSGENGNIYSMSAVAYFFAAELQRELDMPVGILNASLGGSTIRSWLSREAIDSEPVVKSYLKASGEYIEASMWKEDSQSVYYDMTANFNQKIYPLINFRPSGMIWYQGESDLMLSNTQYPEQFSLMQKSYTEYFSYENGLFPVIYTQIASYYYSEDGLAINDWNIMYNDMQKEEASSRGMVTISDVPVTYVPEAGLIHPERKEEVGSRMAFSAMGMVYGKNTSFTAPAVKAYEIKDGSIYVKFSDAGDGLVCGGEVLKGFAVCSDDLIYVAAKAEIIDKDTVRVYCDDIAEPYGFSYAYCVDNIEACLFASEDGEKTLPVSTFVSEKSDSAHYWFMPSWTDCGNEKVWFTQDDTFSGYYDLWTAENAELSYDKSFGISGKGLKVSSSNKKFSASPVLTYKDGINTESFSSVDTDYSDYSEISFYVKNCGTEDVVLKSVKFYENAVLWYSPAVKDTLDVETVIPADGEYHKITLDLGRVYHLGNECSLSYDNEKLKNIKNIELCFSSKDKNAEICLDSFTFTPSEDDAGTRYEVDLRNADSAIEFFTGLVLFIFGRFVALFG